MNISSYPNDLDPKLVELAEKAKQKIEHANLVSSRAKVALCLDVSEVMQPYLGTGKVQHFAEKILALGTLLDSNACIDIFLFGGKVQCVGEMNTVNFKEFLNEALENYRFTGEPDYTLAINKIRDYYFSDKDLKSENQIIMAEEPILVMFVTNGKTIDEDNTISQLEKASYEPIFWQFMTMGITKEDMGGGIWAWLKKPFAEDYSFLEKLDNMHGRLVDNASFFNVADPFSASPEKLYELMMKEYPEWLKMIKSKGMIA